jgi:hypothetical protein
VVIEAQYIESGCFLTAETQRNFERFFLLAVRKMINRKAAKNRKANWRFILCAASRPLRLENQY